MTPRLGTLEVGPQQFDLVVVGGSAGSFQLVNKLLADIPASFPLPLVMCLHRLKDKREGFKEALEIKSRLKVVEPDDKQPFLPGHVYLAPANYHLLIENHRQFSLSTTELVQFSRPSIDVLFESAADIFRSRLLGVVLSGANRDGALGAHRIKQKGGMLWVQEPGTAGMPTMPQAAAEAGPADALFTPDELMQVWEKWGKTTSQSAPTS